MDVRMTEKCSHATQQSALAEQILYRLFATLSQFSTAILSFGPLNIIRLVTFVKLKLTLYVGKSGLLNSAVTKYEQEVLKNCLNIITRLPVSSIRI